MLVKWCISKFTHSVSNAMPSVSSPRASHCVTPCVTPHQVTPHQVTPHQVTQLDLKTNSGNQIVVSDRNAHPPRRSLHYSDFFVLITSIDADSHSFSENDNLFWCTFTKRRLVWFFIGIRVQRALLKILKRFQAACISISNLNASNCFPLRSARLKFFFFGDLISSYLDKDCSGDHPAIGG